MKLRNDIRAFSSKDIEKHNYVIGDILSLQRVDLAHHPLWFDGRNGETKYEIGNKQIPQMVQQIRLKHVLRSEVLRQQHKYVMGVACQQGKLIFPDTWLCPFFTNAY